MLTHSGSPPPFPGRIEIFQNQGGGRKRGGKGEFLKSSLGWGGGLLEMKLQTENKIPE